MFGYCLSQSISLLLFETKNWKKNFRQQISKIIIENRLYKESIFFFNYIYFVLSFLIIFDFLDYALMFLFEIIRKPKSKKGKSA